MSVPAKKITLRMLSVLILSWMPAPPGQAQQTIAVSYVSATSVYLDAGRAAGLAVGDRLEVRRGGEVIAELEVAFVADHSASCRLVKERRTVEPGDPVVLVAKAPTAAEEPAPPVPETPRPIPIEPSPRATGQDSALDFVRSRGIGAPWARLSGTLSWRWQKFEDDAIGRGYDESTARLNLNLRELGGRPYDLRVRLRGRQSQRDGDTASERHDRLYEFALIHEPPEGRFSFLVGRLGASPFATLGYLDGFLGQFRVHPKLSVGAFYGTRPQIEELGFESSGQKYGGFVKLDTRSADKPFFAEVVVAGVAQYEGGEVDREYLAIESRFGSTERRWRFYQRAEIDVNSDWRKALAGDSYQVSNLTLSGSFRPSDFWRLSVSYDERRRFRTLDTREIPEDRFDDFLRQGLRASASFGRPRDWNGSLTVGYRGQEGGVEPTYSVAGSVHNANFLGKKLLVGLNFSSYSGETTDGLMLTLQARKYFRGGHDVGLTVGSSTTTVKAVGGFAGDTQANQWLRLSSSIRLPRRFFLLAELEVTQGDDLEGQRLILELGYRF